MTEKADPWKDAVRFWIEEARHYAENADYWKAKCEAMQAENTKMREALISMRQAAAGFAYAVRNDSGVPYPWPALDIADAQAEAALQETER